MNIQHLIHHHQLASLFQQGSYGLEKESLRVHKDGSLSLTPHPAKYGNRAFHPYIQTDFAESQLELITPPNKTLQQTIGWLSALHQIVLRTMPCDEYIFPFSMPPALPAEEHIKVAQLDKTEDVFYREHLVDVYGKKKQLVSGIHYNFQLSPEFVQALYQATNPAISLVAFQNQLYLKMTRQFLRYQWILVYLLSATPTVDKGYFRDGSPLKKGQYVRSLRSSQYGYVNAPEIQVSYQNLNAYVESLEHWVNTGKLIAEKEFYSNARLRGANKACDLLDTGIQYVEFRLFDLNPFEQYGMSENDAHFIHYFILLMLYLDEQDSEQSVEIGKARLAEVALENPLEPTKYQDEGEAILAQMQAMLEAIHAPTFIQNITQTKQQQFANPSQTLCGKVVNAIEEAGDYQTLGANLAQQYKKNALETHYRLDTFAQMELSTQALIFDAIVKGIHVEILDAQDNFLKLCFQGKVEYVKNGNMTSKDSYISPLIMENKVVTNKVLAEKGFNVPKSHVFTDLTEACNAYPLFAKKAVVIKPKSTNFGLGISIFQQGVESEADFTQALTLAFKEDHAVMVEDYLQGTEYRFFVVGDETKAVLLRVPANVVGDGIKTINELVVAKNQHPLRGDGKHSPLKKIELGDIELLQLKNQGYTPESVPAKGEMVQLRANSNISTGGDSIDVTDEMHSSYKKLAVEITHAMGAKVCGVDLIIPDLTQVATGSLQSWGVIEANFNPMMMMHIFPHQGKSRRVTENILTLLFPQIA